MNGQETFLKKFHEGTTETYGLDWEGTIGEEGFLVMSESHGGMWIREEIVDNGALFICYSPPQSFHKGVKMDASVYIVYDCTEFHFYFIQNCEYRMVDKLIRRIMGTEFDLEKFELAMEYASL